jgi:lipoate-protein ligase A
VLILDRAGHDPAQNLAWEESLFRALRATPRPALLFYVNDPCLVLGRGNKPGEWANLVAAEADGLPVLRRFSGGGAVYHDRRNLNYSFLLPRPLLGRLAGGSTDVSRYIDFFRDVVIRALERGGGGLTATGISDISLGGRKISGNAQRIAAELVLHHGTVLLECPLEAIERYLPVPPNRPGLAHRDFVTGLRDEGRREDMATIKEWIAAEFRWALSG